jgi:hypothetical protein
MRLWTLHPQYLDGIGLVALWREGLLAQKVLKGRTKGYTHHPQLSRFKECADPLAAISFYLLVVYEESLNRNYVFDRSKICDGGACDKIFETSGQVHFEWKHLMAKLRNRDPRQCRLNETVLSHTAHPLFQIVPGPSRE